MHLVRAHLEGSCAVLPRGLMEAPYMDANEAKPSSNLAQNELEKSRLDWTSEKVRRVQQDAQIRWVYPDGGSELDPHLA